MGLCILSHSVMHIVGSNQIDSSLSVHTEKLLVYILLLRNPMILKLQKKITLSKNILISKCCNLGILIHATDKIAGYLAGQTGT